MTALAPTLAEDDATRLANTLGKLSQVQEPSELVYGDTPLPTSEPPAGVEEDYSITVARRVSTVLGRLSELSKSNRQRVLTPRGVLLELMDIVQHGLFLSLPAEMRHVGRERSSLASAFHTYLSSRRIPVESMMEGLHTLTYVSVKLRFELVTLQLKQRLREEMASLSAQADAAANRKSASKPFEEELAALVVTETLLADFVDMFTNALLITPVISTAANAALRSPVAAAVATSSLVPGSSQLALHGPHALSKLLPTLERYYYQLGDWIMVTTSAAAVESLSFTKVAAVALDEKKGTVTCNFHRPHTKAPWGLLFNERGRLIGMDTSMRVGEKAGELHTLLRCSQDGARVVAVNGVAVRRPRRPAGGAAPEGSQEVLKAVQTASQNHKRLQLTLSSENFKAAALHAPAELVFSRPAQGGEGASGQRAALLFHRLNTKAVWQFAIDGDLMWFPPPPKLLTEDVHHFVRSFPYRLRVFAVNGVEVTSPAQVRDIVDRVEVLLLELVVVPVKEAAVHGKQAQRMVEPAKKDVSRMPVEQVEAAVPAVRVTEVSAADVSAIEQQVREATQRLMLSHAQQEELREIPLVDLSDSAAAEAQSTADAEDTLDAGHADDEMVTEEEAVAANAKQTIGEGVFDDAAEQILQDMLKAAGVDTGDSDTAPAAARTAPKRKSKSTLIDDSQSATQDNACLFENGVKLTAFDGKEMTFLRPSTEHPWGIKIMQQKAPEATDAEGNALPLCVQSLPDALPASLAHPFLSQFNKGKKPWVIEQLNGKSAAVNPKKTLDRMRKATKMTLKLVRF